jgi:hypothetical protein
MSSILILGPTQPPHQWVHGALFLGVKQPEHAANHSPPTGARVKNTDISTLIPSMSSCPSVVCRPLLKILFLIALFHNINLQFGNIFAFM